ncbi:hypothetical protein BV20DRAFT_959099, partial [Pilatotrama ljubarskyi]
VVIRYRYKLVGWPLDIPFCNLSEIRGGMLPLCRLLALWNQNKLRFERATPADLANAARDPKSVHPSPKHSKQLAPPSASTAVVVAPLALHPGDLTILGLHPTSTRPSPAVLGARPRRQRNDVKKARARPVTNPDNHPPKRPRAGVKSAEYVLESDIEEPAAKRGRYWPVDDPILEFVPVLARDSASSTEECASDSEIDEIETASEGTVGRESESEIEEF